MHQAPKPEICDHDRSSTTNLFGPPAGITPLVGILTNKSNFQIPPKFPDHFSHQPLKESAQQFAAKRLNQQLLKTYVQLVSWEVGGPFAAHDDVQEP